MDMLKRFLIWLRNVLLSLITIPAYITLGISVLIIGICELGKESKIITNIIKEYRQAIKAK